jgi:hypothetical protein
VKNKYGSALHKKEEVRKLKELREMIWFNDSLKVHNKLQKNAKIFD